MAFIYGNSSARVFETMEVLINGIVTLPAEQGVVAKKTGEVLTVCLLKTVDGKTIRVLENQIQNRPLDFPIGGHKCTVSSEQKEVEIKLRDANGVPTGKTEKQLRSNVSSAVFNMTKALIATQAKALAMDFES